MEVNKIDASALASKNLVPLSPTAASLGTFGQTPVSYYTGAPIITVPLANLKYKELGVDMSLSYQNAGGNKPDLAPGFTGNGWLFSCGGAITLLSKGITPADIGSGQSVLLLPYATNGPTWKDSSTLANEMFGKKFPYDINGKRYDEFSYNFGNATGRFYSDYTDTTVPQLVQHIQTIQGEDLTVQKIIITSAKNFLMPVETQDGTPYFSAWWDSLGYLALGFYRDSIKQNHGLTYGFIVTDSRGVKYTFGNTDESIEFTRVGLDVSTPDKLDQNVIPSTWYLTSIQSPNGATIKFRYKRDHFYTVATAAVKGNVTTPSQYAGANIAFDLLISATLYNPTYLDSVITPASYAKFYWSIANQQLAYSMLHPRQNSAGDTLDLNSPYTFDFYPDVSNALNMDKRFSNKLDSFTLYAKDGNRKKVVQFIYTSDTTTRLKLLSTKISGASTADGSQQYQFQYDTIPLPGYRAFKTDKYGFYDGRPPTISIRSGTTSYYSSFLLDTNQRKAYIASREPDTTYTLAEVLRKIIYPTGGYSYFEYENNRYGRVATNWPTTLTENASDSVGGGLRIKSITNYDFANHVSGKKRYYYYKNYASGGRTSSGVLNFKPVFYTEYNGTITNPQIAGYLGGPYPGTIAFKQFSTDPIYAPSYHKTNFITYSEVAEVNADNSYTVFTFKNYDNGYADKPAENILVDNPQVGNCWQEDEVNSLDLERGQMLTQSRYDTSGKLRSKTVYDYNDTISRFSKNVRILKAIPNSAFSPNFPTLRYLAYLAYTYYPFLKRQTQYEYTSTSDSIVTVTSYVYDTTYRSLLQQSTVESDSSLRTIINRYPPDMVALGQTTPYQTMVSQHQIGAVIEQEHQYNGTKIFKQINAFATGLSDNTSLILPSSISAQFRNRTPELRLRYLKYDSLGNLLSSAQPGGIKNNYVWGYARSLLLASIANVPYDSVVSAIGGQTAVNSLAALPIPKSGDFSVMESNLRNSSSLNGSMILTYQYDPIFGLTQQTDPRRMTTYYAYDFLGRLSTVRNNDGAVTQQYCYDYAGQPSHCFVNSDVASYQFYWSNDHTSICDISHHMGQVALVTLYTLPHVIYDTTGLVFPQFTGYFSDNQLSQLPTDGYYTIVNNLILDTIPKNFYISGGQIFYTGICSGGAPPLSLRYTDTIRLHDICDTAYPTKYVYTTNNDTPALGRTLYGTYQLNTPVANGYYLYNGNIYHTNNGLVDSAMSCQSIMLHTCIGHTMAGVAPHSPCTLVTTNTTYYFRNASGVLGVGVTLYVDSGTTTPLNNGVSFFTDLNNIYRINSSGVLTQFIQACH